MVLQVYIDDSKTGEEVLVLAGYMADLRRWEQLSKAWEALLKEHPPWVEFKMTRAVRHPARAQRFYRVVEDHVAAYVACVVEMQPLKRLCRDLSLHRFCENPYNWAIKAVAGATYMELGRVGLSHPLEFIFDERGEEKHVRSAWPFFLAGMPAHARRLILGEPRFERSHEAPPLQAAEILAWHAREHWLKHKRFDGDIALSWPQANPIKGLLVHWDYDALKPNMESLQALLIEIGAMPKPKQ